MYYYEEVINPPLTLESSPIITKMKLAKGTLEFIDIGFPDWNSRLCKCKVFYNTIQILPMNRDRWLTGDNITLRVPINLLLNDEPYEIRIETFNLDDTFSHQLSFGLSLDIGQVTDVNLLMSLLPALSSEGS